MKGYKAIEICCKTCDKPAMCLYLTAGDEKGDCFFRVSPVGRANAFLSQENRYVHQILLPSAELPIFAYYWY